MGFVCDVICGMFFRSMSGGGVGYVFSILWVYVSVRLFI